MMWLTLILRQWQVVVILLLSCALGASMLHGRFLKSELDAKIAEISAMRIVAQSYADQSKTIAKESSDAFTLLVGQIKDKNTALNAARAKFGTCNVAGGITAVRLPDVPAGAGEADRTETTHATEPELVAVDRPFIDHCALDAGHLQLWQQWAIANDLPVR